jgi:prolyl-tRNA editing enzyme YbaK/EbsC (Cys-tRNA(Pro) deacylase)
MTSSTDDQHEDQAPARRRAGATERVRASLAANGLGSAPIREFDASTATSADAAAAIGTSVERIVKSLVFMAGEAPLLVLASGSNRVDTRKLAVLAGQPVRRANADQVREATGFAIGGVPPLGHARALRTFVDRDLLQYDEVWAAAGTPNSVFAIAPEHLVRVAGGTVADVAEAPRPTAG